MTPMRMELRKTFQFEAAHLLPHLPKSHKCRRLHGHSFKVEVAVQGECDAKLGWVMDYADHCRGLQADLGKAGPLLLERHSRPGKSDERKHRALDLGPVQAGLPLLTEIVVAETCTARCVYRGAPVN